MKSRKANMISTDVSDGSPNTSVGDQSGRLRTHEELQQSEERYRQIFENDFTAFFSTKPDGTIVDCNPACAHMLGFASTDEAKRANISTFYRDIKDRHTILEKLSRERKIERFEVEMVNKQGSRLHATTTIVGLFDKHDNLVQISGYAFDDTKRRESEQLYRSVFENAKDVIYLIDSDGKFVSISPAFKQITGWDPQEWVGKSFEAGVHPDDRSRTVELFQAILKGQETSPIELRVASKSADYLDIEVKAALIHQDGLPFVVGFARDITEQKQAVEQLRASEEKFRALIEHSKDSIVLVDAQARVLFESPAAERLIGYSKQERLGQVALKWVHPDDVEHVQGIFARIASEPGLTHIVEFRLQHEDGSWRWVEAVGTNLLNLPAVSAIVINHHDVTDRRWAEESLRASEQFFESIVENIPHMIFVKDARDLKFVRLNRAAESIIGVTREELLGHSDYDFFPKHEADFFVENDRKVLQSNEILDIPEEALETRKGKRILHTKKISILGSDGEPRFLLGISEDITERKEMDTKQKSLEEQLYRSQRLESLGTLAGGIAHDLNNVLGPIMLSIHVLKSTVKERKSLDMLSIIERSAKRGSDIVKQILTFARGTRGEKMLVQLRFLMSDLSRIFRETFPRSIHIEVNAPKDLWPILGDPTQIDQILMNLAVNARDAMPEGGELTVSAANIVIDEKSMNPSLELKKGRYVHLSVKDTGIGIPSSIIDRIFDPFFTTKEVGKGTGLGLSTVIGIVRAHGGQVNVVSEPDKGTEFEVWLPATASGLAEESLRERNVHLPGGNGQLVLLVDDETAAREVGKEILLAHGYSVITADDGIQAISHYHQNKEKIKVVMTDLMMPFLDGIALIDAVRKSNPNLKIIVASGLLEEERLEQLRSKDGVVVLQKPFSTEQLLVTMDDILNGS